MDAGRSENGLSVFELWAMVAAVCDVEQTTVVYRNVQTMLGDDNSG